MLAVATSVATASSAGAGSDAAIYSTDFSDPVAAAAEWEFPNGATHETGDGYTLDLAADTLTVSLDGIKNLWVGPTVGAIPANQIVEATVANASGDSSLLTGVICRGSLDDDLGYAFLIAADGYYTIGSYAGPGVRRLVNAKGTKRSDAIDSAGRNTVRGVCRSVGKKKVRLTMFVNDEKVASAVDRTTASKTGPDAYVLTEVDEGRAATAVYSSFIVAAAGTNR